MVGRLIQNQAVGTGDHKLAEHAAYFFSSGEYLYLFHAIFTGKEHSAKKTPDIGDILDLGCDQWDG